MNIILMGYRGSGKTTIGRILADQLWKTFRDTDELIRQSFGGMTIARIWEQHGEPAFRQREVEIAVKLCAADDQVIALGGGTVMQPGAREAIEAAKAVRIYLYCQTSELARRIQADPVTAADRPSLTGEADLEREIEKVLERRDPVYRQIADHVFDVTLLAPEDATRYLIKNCL
ncbi:MAG: shikimate kinase [Phycisphaeraceae bacterium]|nr:shikimate kinase [Phycisphaeraceae bacterium]